MADAPTPQHWEYKTVFLSTYKPAEHEHQLALSGKNGWELVTVVKDIAYLKRPILATLALLAATMLAGPAYALREPTPSKLDPHIGHVAYEADNVIHLSAEVGREITVVLGPTENIPAGNVAVSDKADLRALPAANVLFLKPIRAMAPQPITVRAVLPDGTARLYVFEFDAHDPGVGGSYWYKVEVDYPHEAALARAAAWRKRAQEAAVRQASAALRAAPSAFALNKAYVGQGNAGMLPTREVWDDGQFTYFRLPNHTRVPAFYVLNPDGKEALVSSFNKVGDVVSVPQTAKAWRLRDGDSVLYVWNLGFNPIGNDTGTGTVSPDVVRTTRVAAP
ncbi:MAG: TrbG/VirB9 family P-type conjugative transfer protein [Pseudomonadota bacterium]|nr:TrbG/VirB9 family P-type conjugative transfer protein [Pseudomonadota bacterium]